MVTRPQRGFTLVEMIVTIVLIGIVAGMVAVFIRVPVQGYVDSVGRAEVTDTADLALRRMARDLRLALPNSIRVTTSDGHAIEMLLTSTGGRYLGADDGVSGGGNVALDFLHPSAGAVSFSVANPMPSMVSRLSQSSNNYLVVYNLGPGFDPADAYQYQAGNPNGSGGKGTNIARITGWAANGTSITIANNPFGNQTPQPLESPNHRFQVVTGPVTYRCALENGDRTIRRYWNYTISATQPDPPSGGQSALIATHVNDCNNLFRYTAKVAGERSGLVVIALALRARNDTDPSIRLVNQVHVDNTP